MSDRNLYVVTCISNPIRYSARYRLYQKFAKHMADAGVILYTVEMAFGDRPHEITDANNPHHIQLRSDHEIWHKENMLNIAISRLPASWQYVAWIDADITFQRPDWALETIEQLQHYHIVQLFSHAQDLDPRFQPIKLEAGFVHEWYHSNKTLYGEGYSANGHPGYAWAARRETIDKAGGLIDFAVLGSADRHMAFATIGRAMETVNPNLHPNYHRAVETWQERLQRAIQRNVGYVPGIVSHYWHGSKERRGYLDRWRILVDNQFDPYVDIHRDGQGLLRLSTDKLGLRDGIRRYFRQRDEDSIDTGKFKELP